jgi:hypothetical protein
MQQGRLSWLPAVALITSPNATSVHVRYQGPGTQAPPPMFHGSNTDTDHHQLGGILIFANKHFRLIH